VLFCKHPQHCWLQSLRTYDILDEENPVAEAQRKLVEKLDILEKVVVAGPRVAVLVVVPVNQQLQDNVDVKYLPVSIIIRVAETCQDPPSKCLNPDPDSRTQNVSFYKQKCEIIFSLDFNNNKKSIAT
jgi:hypothetical protein